MILGRCIFKTGVKCIFKNITNFLSAIREVLFKEYKARATRLRPLPWLDGMRLDLDKVYTKLDIVRREKNGWQISVEPVELSGIFKKDSRWCENPRCFLIEGSPGIGKTTLSLKLAYDWAKGEMESTSEFPPVQLVLLIKCRDMNGDVLEAINEQLFPLDEDNLKNKLRTIIEKQPEKILLVVDGLDETPETAKEHLMNLLTGKCLRKCCVVATSRQEKGWKVRQYFDVLLEIKGYSKSAIEENITRYFQDNKNNLAKRLIENLRTDINIRTLATNPLNAVLLCVVFEDYGGKLPSTVTELYDNIVYCITKRYCNIYDLSSEDSRLERSKETLGKLAYDGLLVHALFFLESALDDCTTIAKKQCTKMGFLYKEHSKNKIKQDHTYWFLDKTFQEYLAAFYLTEKVKRQELTVGDMIDKLKDTKKFMQVLKFISGMLHKYHAVHHMAVVEKLGTVLSQTKGKDVVLDILCEVLSESPVDKDMAGIIRQFLPESFLFDTENGPYHEYAFRILPRILNLLCTKDGINKEVDIEYIYFYETEMSTSKLRLICGALMEKLKVRKLEFDGCPAVDDDEEEEEEEKKKKKKKKKILANTRKS